MTRVNVETTTPLTLRLLAVVDAVVVEGFPHNVL